jgi:hypothetical protein
LNPGLFACVSIVYFPYCFVFVHEDNIARFAEKSIRENFVECFQGTYLE